MTGRLLTLGVLIAILPISVDVPALRDSSGRHETRLEGALGRGQFSLVTRGCEHEVLSEVRNQVRSGALSVEHEFPDDVVIGVRGGVVSERPKMVIGAGPDPAPMPERINHYWNPYLGRETRSFGIGVGYLRAEQNFLYGEETRFHPDVSAHIRIGDSRTYGALRFMEDVPLGSEGYLVLEGGGAVGRRGEAAAIIPLFGPYDGGVLGVKGRLWITPQAALQIRGMIGNRSQYNATVGVTARLP